MVSLWEIRPQSIKKSFILKRESSSFFLWSCLFLTNPDQCIGQPSPFFPAEGTYLPTIHRIQNIFPMPIRLPLFVAGIQLPSGAEKPHVTIPQNHLYMRFTTEYGRKSQKVRAH